MSHTQELLCQDSRHIARISLQIQAAKNLFVIYDLLTGIFNIYVSYLPLATSFLKADDCFISCSVAKLCLTLCDPMNCSTAGFSVHHCLPEFAQTHVYWVSDAIQPSYSLSPPSPLALNFFPASGSFLASQLFTSGGQSIGASASVLSVNEPSGLISFRIERFDLLAVQGTLKSLL